MRGFTIVAAFVVGLTWALTIVVSNADPEPSRIVNPFRKGSQRYTEDDNERPSRLGFGRYEGNPVNALRFSRKVDDELLKSEQKSRRPVGPLESGENQVLF